MSGRFLTPSNPSSFSIVEASYPDSDEVSFLSGSEGLTGSDIFKLFSLGDS